MREFFRALPFALLPLQPAWFALGAAAVGLGGLLRWERWLAGAALLCVLLGSLGQLWAPRELYPQERPPFLGSLSPQASPNLMRPFDLDGMFGWNSADQAGGFAQRVKEGFWRLPRKNLQSGREQAELLAGRWYPLEPGQTYTQSFYLRHDGTQASFQITFFTERGHHPVPTQMEKVAPGIWRVWGSYTAQEGDKAVRAIDFFNGGGDWTYLEVGWAQLERGSAPTPYRPGEIPQVGLWPRLAWWVGLALMSVLVFQGCFSLLRKVNSRWAAIALLLGLAVHLGYGMYQLTHFEAVPARASGFSPQPNFFGHGAVMVAGLAWVLGGARAGGVALLLAAATVWASGSRAAFLALGALVLAWLMTLRRSRPFALAGLMIGSFWLWLEPSFLGRLSSVFQLDSSAESRLQFWHIALKAFREHPLGGVGFGNFPLYYQINLPPGAIETYAPHAHNLLLHLLAEGGLLGLAGFGVLWGSVAVVLVRRSAWRGLVLLGVAFLLNLFDYTFFNAAVYYPLWAGIAWAMLQAEQNERAVIPVPRNHNHPDTLTG